MKRREGSGKERDERGFSSKTAVSDEPGPLQQAMEEGPRQTGLSLEERRVHSAWNQQSDCISDWSN